MRDITTTADNKLNAAKGAADISRASGGFAQKNIDDLQSWQNMFCDMAGVYAICLDSEGVPMTEFSGNAHEIEIIRKYVTPIRIHNIYKRVSESDLEDQAVEITEIPNLRLAAVAVDRKSVV